MIKLSHVIDELIEERGLERDVLSAIIIEGMRAAYEKKYSTYTFEISHNRKTDDIDIAVAKVIVDSVENEHTQISLKKAQQIDTHAILGQMIAVPFELPIGRIEILKAKQIIAQRIKNIEAEVIYKQFKSKEGTLVYGTIHKCERNGFLVKLHDTFAFLPKTAILPDDRCTVGFSIRALLKQVLPEPQGEHQIFLDRTSPDFIKLLFELEIPEVFEKLVEVKKVVRIAGYKSKVLVVSHDKNIDPVGTCVGVGGVRIKPILKELGAEKVDVVGMGDSIKDLVSDALKPAHIDEVIVVSSDTVNVTLDPEERAVAIGRQGNNIALASQLTGLKINIVDKPSRPFAEEGEGEIFEKTVFDTSKHKTEDDIESE